MGQGCMPDMNWPQGWPLRTGGIVPKDMRHGQSAMVDPWEQSTGSWYCRTRAALYCCKWPHSNSHHTPIITSESLSTKQKISPARKISLVLQTNIFLIVSCKAKERIHLICLAVLTWPGLFLAGGSENHEVNLNYFLQMNPKQSLTNFPSFKKNLIGLGGGSVSKALGFVIVRLW